MTPSAIALWRWIYSQRIYVNNKVHLRTEPQGETKESHNYSYNKQAYSIFITLYFWSFCLTPEPQVEPPAALYFFTCGTRKRHVAEVAEWRKVSATSATSAMLRIKNGVLIFREKGCWKQFLRTFEEGWESVRRTSVGEWTYSLRHWLWEIVTLERCVRNLRIVRIMRIRTFRRNRSLRT